MAQTVTRVIPDGDYPKRLNDAYAAAMAAKKDEDDGKALPLLNGEEPASAVLAAEHAALKAEAEADALSKRRVVTLRGLGRQKWRELKTIHPARLEGEAVDKETANGDRLAGVNTATVEDDLVFASISEPKFADRAEYDEWVNNDISEGEFQMLLRDAWSLVNIAQVDPKSLPSSPTRSDGGN